MTEEEREKYLEENAKIAYEYLSSKSNGNFQKEVSLNAFTRNTISIFIHETFSGGRLLRYIYNGYGWEYCGKSDDWFDDIPALCKGWYDDVKFTPLP